MDGLVRGHVNGTVVGTMHAIVKGEVNAVVSMGEITETVSEETAELLPGGEENA